MVHFETETAVTDISAMNRTLLVEEGDDEVNNRQDKKKKEKEKLAEITGI